MLLYHLLVLVAASVAVDYHYRPNGWNTHWLLIYSLLLPGQLVENGRKLVWMAAAAVVVVVAAAVALSLLLLVALMVERDVATWPGQILERFPTMPPRMQVFAVRHVAAIPRTAVVLSCVAFAIALLVVVRSSPVAVFHFYLYRLEALGRLT